MTTETLVQQMAAFVVNAEQAILPIYVVETLKIRLLDALGCALGALGEAPVRMVANYTGEMGGAPLSSIIGNSKTAPDRAALYNGFLVRYLDYNDSYLAKGETCHPSDTIAPVLAAAEYQDISGKEFLQALAISYQVQCRLSDVAPVRAKGFDHTVQGSYAVAAGVSAALKLNRHQTANAIAIAGTAFNALRVTRTGGLSHWKGLAFPAMSACAVNAAFLAMHGITGPAEVFEGNKGFMESISGPFTINWTTEPLDRVTHTIVKKYNAEIHSQSVLEGLEELRNDAVLNPAAIKRVEIELFDVGYHIIGGGEEGDKRHISTKEEADHSLPYMAAAMLLDGMVLPKQYRPERINAEDIQTLLRKISIRPAQDLSDRFPEYMPCRIRVIMENGIEFTKEKADYEGFRTRPINWEGVIRKFHFLAEGKTPAAIREAIIAAVQEIERISVRELTSLLCAADASTVTAKVA